MEPKKVYEGKYMHVTEEPIGSFVYERAHLRPSVQIIPLKDDSVLMIKENRRVEDGGGRWKFVGGFLDKEGLTKEQTAQEELMEEAGFEAGKLVEYHHYEFKNTFNIPITYYLAYDLKENSKRNPDDSEIEEVKWVPLEELYQRVLDGEFDFHHEASVILKVYRDWKNGKLTE